MRLALVTIVLVIFLLIWCPFSWTQVVFVDIPQAPSRKQQQLERVCQFYGLNIVQLELSDKVEGFVVVNALEQVDNKAIIIAGRSLGYINADEILSALEEKYGKGVSVLLLGLTPEIDPAILHKWSTGAIAGCGSIKVGQKAFYNILNLRQIARQLAGFELPVTDESVHHLILDDSHEVQTIINFRNSNQEGKLPIFVKTPVGDKEIFFLAGLLPSALSEESGRRISSERFIEIVPLLMFLRYTFGQQCWHSAEHQANLTIDDAWLTEPYGNLSFQGLLKEMQKADFHTTIAFIPWNYDRSAPDVVSLFRNHRDRFSLCIHGNDHDHYEFYKYDTSIYDPWPAKPLGVQETNVTQAIARMEQFKKLTGLSYEPVMVFPHGIAPARTLGLLKKYNFMATSNADNVPLGCDEPNDVLFWLRPMTLNFENFASLHRYAVKRRTKADIAIDFFLGNPILLYGHHDLFKGGIDSFNRIADVVNDIEPSVKWRSLGFIARHLYLQRIRDDGNYDVRAFCRSIELENTQGHDLTYFVRKEESFRPPIRQVTVDGKLHAYDRSGNDLCLTITIPAGESRLIDIEYLNELELSSIDISKNDPRVNRLRKLSDFRDMTLSKSVLGRAVVYLYYETDLYKLGLKRLAVACLVLITATGVGGWYLLRYIRRHRVRLYEIDGQVEG